MSSAQNPISVSIADIPTTWTNHPGLQFDQTVVLGDPVKYHKYPTPIRRIGFVDPLTKKRSSS
jgi:hypothetical protein